MLREFDFKKVTATFGPVILTEFAAGSSIKVARNEQAWTTQVGASGEATRSKSNNNTGTVTITLQQTSPSNKKLGTYARLDELSNSGKQPLMIVDQNGETVVACASAWIQKIPDIEYGPESSTREWVFETDNLDVTF